MADANTDLIDDDPDISAAVGRILARGPEALGDAPVREDERENRTDREPQEQEEDGELDAERAVETKGKEGAEQAADTGDDQFLEIPGESEEAEPVRVPLSEAADAVKQIRQMNGDIATAVTRAETEAYEKQDRITTAIAGVYEKIASEAKAALELMHQFAPQMPDRALMESDPHRYVAMKEFYEDYVAHYNKVRSTIGQAETGHASVMTEAEKITAGREQSRLARYIPEAADPKTWAAKKGEITATLQSKYGIEASELDGVVSHKAWRMMNDLANQSKVQTKAPEIRKAVQEKAAKITNGKLPPRETGTGRFISDDRKALRETGSIDAAARLFMRSGLTKGL